MALIVLADDGIEFDGESLRMRPLGGVESSIVNLAEAFVRRGHEVKVRNMCVEPKNIAGVDWAPLILGPKYNLPITSDLYIANRGDKLINLMPKAKRTVFWIHNPAQYLLKWRYLSKLWKTKPAIIFIGAYHSSTYPTWAPGGERIVIPYGISSDFSGFTPRIDMPPRRAIFTSNPLRSLDWLLQLWVEKIYPYSPDAEFHLFTGPSTYGEVGLEKKSQMGKILDKARQCSDYGVVLRGAVSKSELITEFRDARVMLYRGDVNETFCLAVGEAQAAGVPAVVQKFGSVVERVIDGETGSITDNDTEFVRCALDLLNNDETWHEQHKAALLKQGTWSWEDVAKAFEGLMIQ